MNTTTVKQFIKWHEEKQLIDKAAGDNDNEQEIFDENILKISKLFLESLFTKIKEEEDEYFDNLETIMEQDGIRLREPLVHAFCCKTIGGVRVHVEETQNYLWLRIILGDEYLELDEVYKRVFQAYAVLVGKKLIKPPYYESETEEGEAATLLYAENHPWLSL